MLPLTKAGGVAAIVWALGELVVARRAGQPELEEPARPALAVESDAVGPAGDRLEPDLAGQRGHVDAAAVAAGPVVVAGNRGQAVDRGPFVDREQGVEFESRRC